MNRKIWEKLLNHGKRCWSMPNHSSKSHNVDLEGRERLHLCWTGGPPGWTLSTQTLLGSRQNMTKNTLKKSWQNIYKKKQKNCSKKFKKFQRGPNYDSSLLTRIRAGNSKLISHKFETGLSPTTECLCAHPDENSTHYITQCFLYTEERRILFDQVSQFVPNFPKLSKKRQYDILVFGHEPENVDMLKINTKILILTQKYIRSTKRFYEKQ